MLVCECVSLYKCHISDDKREASANWIKLDWATNAKLSIYIWKQFCSPHSTPALSTTALPVIAVVTRICLPSLSQLQAPCCRSCKSLAWPPKQHHVHINHENWEIISTFISVTDVAAFSVFMCDLSLSLCVKIFEGVLFGFRVFLPPHLFVLCLISPGLCVS